MPKIRIKILPRYVTVGMSDPKAKKLVEERTIFDAIERPGSTDRYYITVYRPHEWYILKSECEIVKKPTIVLEA